MEWPIEKGRLLYESVIGQYVMAIARLVNKWREVEHQVESGRTKQMMVKMLNKTIVEAMKEAKMR